VKSADGTPALQTRKLKIEIQLRSQYQHAWATAVETVGTFIGQALKSSMGQEQWLRFFQLMGTAIAVRESTPPVPATPANSRDLREELIRYADELSIVPRLEHFRHAIRMLAQPSAADQQKAYYYLLELDARSRELTVSGFKRSESERASQAYLEAEKSIQQRSGLDAVLVSVDSISSLEKAYPNYFADTRVFTELVNQSLTGQQREIEISTSVPKCGD